MSSSGGSPALSPSSTRAARGAVLALLGAVPGDSLAEGYRAAIGALLEILAAHIAARRGLAEAPPPASTVAATLAGGSDSSHSLLSGVYEDLLRLEPVEVKGRIGLRVSQAARKRTGSFYTPSAIAREVVRCCIEGAPAQPRILDPAMGTGVFLIEAARQLSGSVSPREIAEHCLFGMDVDPIAVRVAVLSLWLETGARREVLERHLRQGDALSPRAGLPSAEVVVGNPPWGARYDPAQRKTLAEQFPRVTGSAFDSAKLFVDLGTRLSRGTVGMVLPQSFLAQERHADVRRIFLEDMSPRAALDLGNAFAGAAAPACALIFDRQRDGRTVRTDSGNVPALLWTERGFPLRGASVLAVLRRLQERHPTFGEMGHMVSVRDVGLNYNRASVSRRSLYEAPEPEHPLDLPRYRGRDFFRYGPVRRGGWLRHDAHAALHPGETLHYCSRTAELPAKIVLRQTADRLVATLDRSRMVMGRSVIAVIAVDTRWLLPFLAFLNSGPVTALYRAMAGEEGRVLPQVKVARLHALPVPLLDAADERWVALGLMAERLLAREGREGEAEQTVECLVADLYGLSEAENAVLRQEGERTAGPGVLELSRAGRG